MGGSSWSHDVYTDRATTRSSTGASAFAYDAAVAKGTAPRKVHENLDPKGVKIRESRDSDAHPLSRAIIVGLDVTGSMRSVVTTIHERLPQFMGLLTRKGYLADAHVLWSAVGDARCDEASLQVGQFEAGNEMEDDLGRFFIEGGGGGQSPPSESYQNLLYFAARHTAIDCHEKRGLPGYLFLIGDEQAYDVMRREVEHVMGDGLEADIPIAQMVEEVRKRWNVFMVIPTRASNGSDKSMAAYWQNLLGVEHVVLLDDASAVAETLATIVGMAEGVVDLAGASGHLKDVGASAAVVRSVTSALDGYGKSTAAMVRATGGAMAPAAAASTTRRL